MKKEAACRKAKTAQAEQIKRKAGKKNITRALKNLYKNHHDQAR
jgi:hypothetical protein